MAIFEGWNHAQHISHFAEQWNTWYPKSKHGWKLQQGYERLSAQDYYRGPLDPCKTGPELTTLMKIEWWKKRLYWAIQIIKKANINIWIRESIVLSSESLKIFILPRSVLQGSYNIASMTARTLTRYLKLNISYNGHGVTYSLEPKHSMRKLDFVE